MNVLVSGIDPESTEYQIRGIVDVPSHPFGDEERNYLATRLVRFAEIPEKQKRRFRLVSWEVKAGGTGISVRRSEAIPTLTEKEIFNLRVFTPPEAEDLADSIRISDEQHNEWVREYQLNRYCRFETRRELHQRWQDIQVNTQVLTKSGKIGLTADPLWYQLGQHVITEMLLRGEPPNEKNSHPDVSIAGRFFDGELCKKAADVVVANQTSRDLVVKYGKSQHMKSLFEDGLIYMNPASSYDKRTHNQAIRDDERTITFKGAYSPVDNQSCFFNIETAPENVGELALKNEVSFSLILDCPRIQQNECADHKVHMRSDYWMFCMADVLDQRLFADFEADSCVIIKRRPFLERLERNRDILLRNVNLYFDNVRYVDPLGAFPGTNESLINGNLYLFMTKLFRYSYQREVRFVCIPQECQADLEPFVMQLGSLEDIAEFVRL